MTHLALLLLLQADPAEAILDRVRAARPADEALAVYRHDWAPTFDDALARAAKERRPVFLVVVTNITAGTRFYNGQT